MSLKWVIIIGLALVLPAMAYSDGDFSGLYQKGRAAAKNGNFKQAERYLIGAIKSSSATPNNKARAYYSLAQVYKASGNTEKAMKCGKKASSILGGNKKIDAFVASLQGAGNSGTQTFEGATQDFIDGLTNERLYKGTGIGLLEGSAPVFKKNLTDGKHGAFSNYALGTLALLKGKDDEAFTYLSKSLELDGRNPDAHHRMGEYYLDQEDYDQGLEHMKLYKKYGGATAEGTATLVRAYGCTKTQVDANQIGSLAEEVASSNISMAAKLSSYFVDPAIVSKIDSAVERARKTLASAGPPPTGGSDSSSSSSSKSKSNEPAKEKEPEKTDVEKNYDKYNENRYREYLQHLNRLASGKPSSWSGAIPKKPEKKEKK